MTDRDDDEEGGRGYPCALKEQVDDIGGAMEACLPDLFAHPELMQRFRAALESGDPATLIEITASAFAGLAQLHRVELIALLRKGFTAERVMLDKEGNEIGVQAIANPAAALFLELNKQLGFTADQHALTPKSKGEKQRDEGFGALIGFMETRRKALDEDK